MQTLQLDNRELPYAIREEMKMLRTNLMFCGEDKKVILLTSVMSNEGKSNCAIHLARTLAELGKNVLLVDCDLRKSVLHEKVSGDAAKWGLSHFLAGQCNAESILYFSGMNGLYLIPAGAFPPNPAELLASVRMSQFIQAAREQFDYIVLDAPPLGMVADAAAMASFTDGYLLLVEAGRIPYRMAQNVVTKLKNTDRPILGVILNKVGREENGKYSGYYRGYYHGYYRRYYSGYYKKYGKDGKYGDN